MPGPAPGFFCSRCGNRGADAGACGRDGTALTAITEQSLLGSEVGNYVLVQALGEGGMGSVYRAVHPAIGAEVAIKVLHATSEAHAQRFLLEAQAVNRVRHANLIKILDTGYLADRRPYLVMELLDGVSLADAVGKLAPELACYVAAEALDALAAVHAEGIVHRDLKPPNVFLTRSGRVVVLDFGIAKLVDGDAATQSTDLVGTPEYMAPEQIRSQPLDRRTDLYAMGVLLYETITGKRPFASAITFDMLVQHLERPPTPPRTVMPALAPAIDAAIMRALEKLPAQRYADANEMAAALLAAGGSTIRREGVIAFVQAHGPAPQPVPLEPQRGVTKATGKQPPTKREGPARDEDATTQREGPGRDDGAATKPEGPGAKREVPMRDGTRPESQPRLGESLPTHAAPASFTRRHWLGIGALAILVPAAIVAVMLARRDAPAQATRTSGVQVHDAGTTGVLEIGSEPAGAEVTVDHARRGVTPLTLAVPAGAHLVRVEYAGRGSVNQAVEVRVGERTSAMLVLPEPPATATATATTTGSAAQPPRDGKRPLKKNQGSGAPATTTATSTTTTPASTAAGSAATTTTPTSTAAGSAATTTTPESKRDAGVLPDRKDNPFSSQPEIK
ncbi:MAG TPA: protein kinase [Kofleriaceae bacterium]